MVKSKNPALFLEGHFRSFQVVSGRFRSFRVVSGSFGARRSIFPGNMDTIWIREFGLATGLFGLDMRIWFGNELEWFGYANLDK